MATKNKGHGKPTGAAADPLDKLRTWLEEARVSGVRMPEAATLATATREGVPSARTVSIKRVDQSGLAFGTALGGRKSAELDVNPRAALTFWWEVLGRQVRVEGRIVAAGRDEAELLWSERGRSNRLATLVSRQGEVLAERRELELAYDRADSEEGDDPSCPSNWGVYRIVPETIEFWLEDRRRLIVRERHTRQAHGRWLCELLYP